MLHRFREPVNGFTHLIGVPLGFLGLLWLVHTTGDDPAKALAMAVFGISIMLLYAASAVFHLVKGSERTILILRRLDHAAIYLLIAGTYTPIVYNLLSGTWRLSLLAVVWTLALIGALYKLLFLTGEKGRLVSLITYLMLGWIALPVLPQVLPVIEPGAALLILGGGLAYSIGAVIFAVRWPNFHPHFGHHEIWHLFVLAGTGLHFAAIAAYMTR